MTFTNRPLAGTIPPRVNGRRAIFPASPRRDTPNRIGRAVVRMTSNKQGVLT
jgi:hypothetical protein